MRKSKNVINLLTVLLMLGTSTSSFADINKSPAEMAVNSKMNSEVLYVVEKDEYRQALGKDALVIELKDNVLSVDTENIQEEDLNIINSAESYFVVGSIKDDVFPTKNLGGHIFYKEAQSFINLANIDTGKNLIVTNEESMVDIINATQIGNVEGRNLLLIKDNRINSETKLFLEQYGEDKNILFVEGELSIPDEIKRYVLQLAGSPKYELDTFKISKIVEEKVVDLVAFLPEKLPGSAPVGKDKYGNQVFGKMLKASKDSIDKTSKQSEEVVANNSKLISFEDEREIEENTLDYSKSHKFIKTLKNQEESKLLIQTNREIEENEILSAHIAIKLTYAEPQNIHSYIHDSKDIYVTSKSTSNEIIYSVMEGDYGEGQERKDKLEREGYSYEEIQQEVEAIIAVRERQAKQNVVKVPTVNVMVATQSTSNLINAFLNEALKMQGWDYSQENRFAQGKADCSSLIIRALINTGYTNNTSNMTTRTIMNDPRFYEISMGQIQKGDILWYPGHVEIYMGGNSTFGAFRPGKLAGYASGVNRFSRAFRLSGN